MGTFNVKDKMIMKISIVFILSILCCVMVSEVMAMGEETPIEIVEIFYADLISDKSPTECAEIFNEPEYYVSALPSEELQNMPEDWSATAKFWSYFRKYKNIFLFPVIPPEKTMEKVKISYVFSNVKKNQMFFDAFSGVEVYTLLSRNGREGVLKEVFFSLEKNSKSKGPNYWINIPRFSVNGISLDFADECYRLGNLYQDLGFKTTAGKGGKAEKRE